MHVKIEPHGKSNREGVLRVLVNRMYKILPVDELIYDQRLGRSRSYTS
jgi:hypothetical protein